MELTSTMVALTAELPASAWQALQVRGGATGPPVFEFAAVRVWSMRHRKPGPPVWLLIRRSLEKSPEVEYHVDRNKIAKASHDKTWKWKHRCVKYLRL
jgi:hypothetical protein